MANNLSDPNGDGIAKASRLFQQLFDTNPLFESHARMAARHLREVVGNPADRARITAYFQRQGITYPSDLIAAAWRRFDAILVDMDNETKTSGRTSLHPTGTTPTTSFEDRRRSKATKGSKTKTAKGASSNAWRYDPSVNPGPDYTWIPKCDYEKDSRTVKLRGYWRKRKASKTKHDTAWKFDRAHRPGPNWVWSKGFKTKSGYPVRGHWRQARSCWKKSRKEWSRRQDKKMDTPAPSSPKFRRPHVYLG